MDLLLDPIFLKKLKKKNPVKWIHVMLEKSSRVPYL